MAELADAEDLKSSDGDILWVQVPPAPLDSRAQGARFSFQIIHYWLIQFTREMVGDYVFKFLHP